MLRLVAFALAMPTAASAGEVVWFGSPTSAERIAVSAEALPSGPELDLEQLATASTRFSTADARALDDLEAALAEVRPYESRLDGELVIMRDLARPIDAVSVLRSPADRDVLFKALAYQGFAVDRYFMQSLGNDDEAAPYRLTIDGVVVERPWVDANALDPERSITAYDIAEAPQRVAYAEVQQEVARALPSSLVPQGLQPGDVLVVDGVEQTVGATGSVRVPMGRHFAHVLRNGAIVDRWTVRLEAGEEVEMNVSDPLTQASAWAEQVWSGADAPMPDAVRDGVAALGGDVWLARPGARGVEVVRLRGDTVERQVIRPQVARSQGPRGVSVALGANVGWLSSGNFSLDNPDAQFTKNEVNAFFTGVGLGVDYSTDLLRFGVGLQWGITPGLEYVAEWNSGSTHMRLYPHVSFGLRWVQLTAGYVMPMHPTAGLKAQLPLVKGLEIQATGWLGVGGKLSRDPFEDYDLRPLYAATIGVGYRFGE